MENEEIEEKQQEENTNAVIKNSDDTDSNPDENLDNNSSDNIETVVKKRNEMAEEAKEQLAPVPEDDEKEDKPKSILKYLGFGLLALCAAGVVLSRKKAQETHNLEQNGELNDKEY